MTPAAALSRTLNIAWRVAIVACCVYGIWWSWKLARADYLFRQDIPSSVSAAIRLVPNEPKFYMRLAQLDEAHARELLKTALRLNPYNAEADIELGLRYEADGDHARAEKSLLEAWHVDHTYLPRWSLANYYLRRGNMPGFWFWARKAAEMPSTDIMPLFQLCWRVTPDGAKIAGAVLPNNPDTVRQYLDFLLGKDQVRAAADVARWLVRYGAAETDRPLLLSVVNRLIAANDAAAATTLWRLLTERHWVVSDTTAPNNATFFRDPLPVGFDWSLPSYDGLHSWPGSSGLEVEFSGSQPETCTMAEQTIALAPGSYSFRYAYRTSGIAPGTGIEWRIANAKSGVMLAASPDLSSDTLRQQVVSFSVSQTVSLIRLRLAYNRALGTPRVSGVLVLLSTGIVAAMPGNLSSVR